MHVPQLIRIVEVTHPQMRVAFIDPVVVIHTEISIVRPWQIDSPFFVQ